MFLVKSDRLLGRGGGGGAVARQFGRQGLGHFRQRRGRDRAGWRLDLRGGRRRREGSGAHNFADLLAIQRLVFEQRVGDDLQLVAICINNVFGTV